MTDLRTFEFHASFRSFDTIAPHPVSGWADTNPVFINGKIIFIDRWSSSFAVQINKWSDVLALKVLIVRHGIMCRI